MIRVGPVSEWAVFIVVVLASMVLDRLLCRSEVARASFRKALERSLLWIVAGMGFSLWISANRGIGPGLDYVTAYLLEKSLSVDNLFVFLVIFRHFGVNDHQQKRVLFWGVFGAIVLRAAFIVLGTEVLSRFHWAFCLFGAFLVFSGIRLAKGGDKTSDPAKSLSLRLVKRYLRTSPTFVGTHFFTRIDGIAHATPLFLVLLVVELSDLVFAVDSVPAVLGITVDLYVVYTSNIMAVLGLRALYFLLAGMMGKFHKLDWALAAILMFVGVKMIGHDLVQIPNWLSLSIIGGLLSLGIGASLILRPNEESRATLPPPGSPGKT
jgi:tellurite resistance protein TerC